MVLQVIKYKYTSLIPTQPRRPTSQKLATNVTGIPQHNYNNVMQPERTLELTVKCKHPLETSVNFHFYR